MDISVIICTFNPSQRIFERCLNAVSSQAISGLDVEFVIIDNNSPVPVSSLEYVSKFLQTTPGSRVIVEKEQGLTHARIKGFKHSTGSLLVFFDDDNEPAEDFLFQAQKIHADRPFIGIMGPGEIHIDYLDGTDPWIRDHLGNLFQQKKASSEEYILCATSWASCYPPGTGQVMKRQIFQFYLDLVTDRKLSTSDRKGKSLSSAGDSQMIWASIINNFAVGHHPLLKVNHLIPGQRANFEYLKKLNFHLALSGGLAYHELFSDDNKNVAPFSNTSFLYQVGKYYMVGWFVGRSKSNAVNVASLLGRHEANVKISNQQMPIALRLMKKWLNIQ